MVTLRTTVSCYLFQRIGKRASFEEIETIKNVFFAKDKPLVGLWLFNFKRIGSHCYLDLL